MFSAYQLYLAYESDNTLLDENFVTQEDGSGFSRDNECEIFTRHCVLNTSRFFGTFIKVYL